MFMLRSINFPNDLKYVNITPCFKNDENINKSNYRPISVLPSIPKIIENKISQYYCGFRNGYNTQHALLRLFDKLNKSLDRKEKVGIFMMDLTEEFVCMPHDLLIAK